MRVRVDDRGHHGLASEAHARGARGRLHLPGAADLRDSRAIDDECAVIDRRGPVATDQPRALEDGDRWSLDASCEAREREGDHYGREAEKAKLCPHGR